MHMYQSYSQFSNPKQPKPGDVVSSAALSIIRVVKWRPHWPLGRGTKPRDIMIMEAVWGVVATLADVPSGDTKPAAAQAGGSAHCVMIWTFLPSLSGYWSLPHICFSLFFPVIYWMWGREANIGQVCIWRCWWTEEIKVRLYLHSTYLKLSCTYCSEKWKVE